MHTLVGYYESQDTSAVLTRMAALVDQHITVNGDDILVPDFASKLGWIWAAGSDITQAQISSPSLREKLLLDVMPLNDGADEPLDPPPIDIRMPSGIQLVPSEGLRALVAEDAAGADAEYILAMLFDSIDAVPPGEIMTVRATSATTVTANAWSLCVLTFSQQLEAGRYAVVGMRAEGATALAARLVFPGSGYRPGCLGTDTAADVGLKIFRHGALGSWGEFEHTFPPQVEMLCTAGDTAQVVWLDLVKV